MRLLLISIILLINGNVMANDKVKEALSQFAWEKRQLIVFSPSEAHPQYTLFKTIEKKSEIDFKERNLHTWLIVADNDVLLNKTVRKDVENQAFKDYFMVDKNDFRLILIGYDQGEKLRLESTNIDVVMSTIDQMPMRIQELNQSK